MSTKYLTAGPVRDESLYLTSGRVARRYAKTVRTLDRWLAAGLFPRPDLIIRDRRYWTLETLAQFEQQTVTRSRSGTAEDRQTP
jgi:hypothetical protein